MTFVLKPGQTDYTNVHWAPVINCVVEHKSKILVVKRSRNLHLYPDLWNGISGFLDTDCSLEEKVREELKEELGIRPEHMQSITLGSIFDQPAPEYNKTWIVHPVLVNISTNDVTIDWEATGYKWTTPAALKKLNLLPGFDQVLKSLGLW